MERIEAARLTREDYSIPPEFPGLEILRNAWSIVMGEDTMRVLLRFRSETAKARVLETCWHPSQRTNLDPANSNALLLEFKVADTLDLIPWVRSWGAHVEVLEPEGLRQDLIHAIQQLGEQYQVRQSSQRQPYQWLHAKTDSKNSGNIHLLLYHLIDVGQVALQMWNEAFPDSFRNHNVPHACGDEPQKSLLCMEK